ncbi:MAG: nickel pincer cofactor biosynthesis protein LarC [Vicinamibacterales bacterium]
MSRVLYFDCYAGAAGDMILGALIDAGLPVGELRAALGSITIGGYEIAADRVLRAGVSATKFRLIEESPAGADPHTPPAQHDATTVAMEAGGRLHHHAHEHLEERRHEQPHGQRHDRRLSHPDPDEHRDEPAHLGGGEDAHVHGPERAREHQRSLVDAGKHLPEHAHGTHRTVAEITRLIEGSALGETGRKRAVAMFRRLAEAEAEVHQVPIEKIHLHEVGALDSIVDIVGTVFALEWFGAARVVASPLNVGGGTVRSAHGVFPVPAPATLRLLSGAPIYSSGVQTELVTPTGALLVTEYASSYGPVPAMTVERAGYGAGDRDIPSFPNTFRVLVGEEDRPGAGDRVVVIESAIDDMNPQIFGVVMEKLYAAGALEVYYQSVQMKKNRPGTLVTVIARPDGRPSLTRILFSETTTIGLRYQEVARECLERGWESVETPYGAIRIKVARLGGETTNWAPEFDDCARLAADKGVPVKRVIDAASRAWADRGRL